MLTKTFHSVFGTDINFPLRVRFSPQEPTLMHTHDFVELVVVTAGSGMHQTHHGCFPISKGNVFAIPRHGQHAYLKTERLRIMNVIFDPDRLPMPQLDLGRLDGYHAFFSLKEEFFSTRNPYPMFSLNSAQFQEVEAILNMMEIESTQDLPGQRFFLLSLFMNLIVRLSRFYGTSEQAPADVPKNLGRVISHLNQEFYREITLQELQKISGMSRSTLLRGFQRAVGSSPIDYLLDIRINHACTRLRESADTITEIAYAVGFNDSNYFTRLFGKRTGLSPRQYRMRKKSGEDQEMAGFFKKRESS